VQRERSFKEALARRDKKDYWFQPAEAGHSHGGQGTMEEIGQCRHLLLTMFINNHWLQVIAEPTRFNNILDLVLSNNPLHITHYHLTDPLGAGDHDSIIFTISLSNKDGDVSVGERSATSASFITWNPESIARAQNYLLLFHWELIFVIESSAEAVWLAFKRILTACIAACACTRKVSFQLWRE